MYPGYPIAEGYYPGDKISPDRNLPVIYENTTEGELAFTEWSSGKEGK